MRLWAGSDCGGGSGSADGFVSSCWSSPTGCDTRSSPATRVHVQAAPTLPARCLRSTTATDARYLSCPSSLALLLSAELLRHALSPRISPAALQCRRCPTRWWSSPTPQHPRLAGSPPPTRGTSPSRSAAVAIPTLAGHFVPLPGRIPCECRWPDIFLFRLYPWQISCYTPLVCCSPIVHRGQCGTWIFGFEWQVPMRALSPRLVSAGAHITRRVHFGIEVFPYRLPGTQTLTPCLRSCGSITLRIRGHHIIPKCNEVDVPHKYILITRTVRRLVK